MLWSPREAAAARDTPTSQRPLITRSYLNEPTTGIATRVGRLTASGFDPMIGRGGPVARARSIGELG